MAEKTIVSSYLQEKFDSIKKDSFLEEISKLSLVKQKEALIKEIADIEAYIKIIKNNYYNDINGKKVYSHSIKEYLSSLKKIVNKYHEYYKYLNLLEYHQTRKEHIDNKIEFESSDIILSNKQTLILNNINENNINNFKFDDLVNIVKYMIQNFTPDNLRLIELIINRMENIFIDSNYSDDNFIAISSVKNVLTYKINCLEKNDNNRQILKKLKRYVKSMVDFSKEKEVKSHDYRVDIINDFLDNKIYLQKIIQRKPEWLNLLDDDNNTFVITAINRYLDLYLLELEGKQNGIPKEKYLEVYFMLQDAPGYKYKDIDKIKINTLFNNFKETIKNGDFKRSTYLEVSETLEKALIKKDFTTPKKSFNEEIIDFENKNILNNKTLDKRIDLTDEYTFVLTSSNADLNNYAYSVGINESGNYILKLHVTDVSKFIEKDSYLDELLKSTMFKEKEQWLEETLLNKFSLKKGLKQPVITFECEILSSGRKTNLKCFRSNIVVDDVYTFEEFNKAVKDDKKKFATYLSLGYFLNKDLDKNNYGASLEYIYDKSILGKVGKYFNKHNYPYIYKIQSEQDSKNYMKLLTKLNYLLSKISREDAKVFYNIVCDDINYSKYSEKPEYHCGLDQKYYTDLLIPLYSYIGLYLQYLVNIFMIDASEEEKNMIKDVYTSEVKEIVELANLKKEEKRINKQKKLINID